MPFPMESAAGAHAHGKRGCGHGRRPSCRPQMHKAPEYCGGLGWGGGKGRRAVSVGYATIR